jgi:uncharacterized protein (DUF885 family)
MKRVVYCTIAEVMIASEPLHPFVDGYLAHLHESRPTAAALDGVHQFDDHLEDFSRAAIEADVHSLAGFARRLSSISTDTLTPTERVERTMLASHIQSRIFELEKVRTWERNPQLYGETLAASLAAQALFGHAPEEDRARRVLSKLRQAPRLLQAARDNIKDPPGLFVRVGLETLRGTLKFIEHDMPRAFSGVDDLHILSDLADASTEATDALRAYIDYLEKDVAPRARASFRLGRERFVEKLRLDEGIDIDLDRLLNIGLRELGAVQEEFRRVAGRVDSGDPLEVWRTTKNRHPAAGEVVAVAGRQLQDLLTFIERRDIVTVPAGEPVVAAPTPDFYRWTFASMWTPGPFEARPSRAYYYLTDVDPAWPTERQEEHLRDLSTASLWSISIHEVYPGHYLHYQHLRRVASKARRSAMLAPASCVEGWAHYCEQMMMEAGFERQDPTIRLGQLSEALVRLARLVVAIRLHAEDMSVEQGVRFFREEAFLEEGSARREAERATFDPTYLVYAAGRLMLLKLREDYKALMGSKYSLRAFHDAFLDNGTAPFWAQRQLMLGDGAGSVLD